MHIPRPLALIKTAADDTAFVSSTQSWTTLAAAVAALAAITGAGIGWFNASKSRQWGGRDQWRTRFSWAIEKSISSPPRESKMGLPEF